ncbi:hypothetical protein [Paraburkholderia sp. SOS3]|uniref:hypothetical protein n=1 Tax=Paraburkholderia sp. SOS3 TaxID=1926494 RepID=UPI00094778B5|nr:hypothetical protein [Paraburkholderia sp. SOS3]APR37882.1 hypothetical protein BTO02_20155 [Paraburkholderia sp. SOS3]APR40051.1 hypothetical protein BTO02_33475 [Paraburkholderia sp. SOS3]APR40482.1 hypothetical protein BTO02_33610 [Paraburkholderia sp. SOS3]
MIGAALLALVTHVQVLPVLDKQFDVQPGAIVYAEIPPSTRLSLSVVKGAEAPTVKASIRWKF